MSSSHSNSTDRSNPSDVRSIDDTTYGETPAEELIEQRRESGVKSNHFIPIGMWAEEHDVFLWFLPLIHRESNPLQTALEVGEYIDSLVETAQTFKTGNIEFSCEMNGKFLTEILRLHQVVLTDRQNCNGRICLNPNYIHYETVTTPIETEEEKIEFYENYARMGTCNIQWLATHCGFTESEFVSFIEAKTGENPAQTLTRGRKRVIRTIETADKWTSYSLEELSIAMNVPTEKIQQWRQQWVVDAEWNPPPTPENEPWFKPPT